MKIAVTAASGQLGAAIVQATTQLEQVSHRQADASGLDRKDRQVQGGGSSVEAAAWPAYHGRTQP